MLSITGATGAQPVEAPVTAACAQALLPTSLKLPCLHCHAPVSWRPTHSVWKVLPWPLPPQMPRIKGTCGKWVT